MYYEWLNIPGVGWVKGNYIDPTTIATQTATATTNYGQSSSGSKTTFTATVSAAYPFNAIAPSIDWNFTLTLQTDPDRDTIYVTVQGEHNEFPAYGMYGGPSQTELEYSFMPTSTGPTPFNLSTLTDMAATWIV